MRLIYLTFIFYFFSTTLVTAKERYTVEESWQRFKEGCLKLIENPDDYIKDLKIPGRYGERVVSKSPDGKVVGIYNRVNDNHYEEITIYRVKGREIRLCGATSTYYHVRKSSFNLVKEFQKIIENDSSLKMVGGHTPQDYVESGKVSTHDTYWQFVVAGTWPSKPHSVLAGMSVKDLGFSVVAIVDGLDQ